MGRQNLIDTLDDIAESLFQALNDVGCAPDDAKTDDDRKTMAHLEGMARLMEAAVRDLNVTPEEAETCAAIQYFI